MADDPRQNSLAPDGVTRSVTQGDVPPALRRRYLTEQARGGAGLGFYIDAAVVIPSFLDRGARLVATRIDPAALRDMAVIARHRGWTAIVVQGGPAFRREAWLAGRTLGLEVRGYRPSERDLQLLERRLETQDRRQAAERPQGAEQTPPADHRPPDATGATGARARLRIVETVVRERVSDPAAQARILAAARERLADLLERGAIFGERPRPQPGGPQERHR